MAISKAWGFTNNTDSTYKLTPKVIDPASYALTTDDPGKCVLKNTTSPIDQVEVLTYQASDIKAVNQTEKNMYPPQVEDGRTVTVKLEDKIRLTSSVDDTFMVDLPVSCNISWRFTKNAQVSASDLFLMLARVVGACQTTAGTSLIGNLMVMDLNPKS